MNKITRKIFRILVMLLLFATGTTAQVLYEGVNYGVPSVLKGQGGWVGINSGDDDINVVSPSLTYSGLAASVGNKISFGGAGIDAVRVIGSSPIASGTVYYSFLLNVTSVAGITSSGYFTGFNEGTATTYGATVWLRADGAGYDIGINRRTTAGDVVWSSGTLSLNSTILVVVSYQMVSGTTNDVVKMWINPTPGMAEPAATLTASNVGTDLVNINRLLLRQSSSTETPVLEMDELRVGTTWASVTPLGTAPEINITGLGNSIPDGDTTPDATDDTDFGNVDTMTELATRTFTIENTGTANLTIGEITFSGGNAAADFSVTGVPPSSPVAPSGSTSLTVTFNPSAVGTRTTTISIVNNDSNENPYNFDLVGTGTEPAPEMNVQGAGNDIANGDATPATTDDTDFGAIAATGTASISKIFTIQNTGDASLTIGAITFSGPNPGDFTISQAPNATVPAGQSRTFTVTFDPGGVGVRNAVISIENNDADENPYSFTISGEGLADTDAIDWLNLQWPSSISLTEGDPGQTVYARVYADGYTQGAGQGANIAGWIGYSTTNSDPGGAGWTWIQSSYFGDDGPNNDEYALVFGGGFAPGTYYYASRFQIGTGPYAYGGLGGPWNNNSGVLTVNANVVDYANIQFPATATIVEGGSANIYAQVYEPGTEGAGQRGGITAWIGYSATDNSPEDPSWTWVPATFIEQTITPNNDEYMASIGSSLAPGTYYYASRFQKDGSTSYVYGGTSGIWNNDSGVLTVILPPPTQLVITSISPSTPVAGSDFSVTVVAQDVAGVASNVSQDTAFTISTNGNAGTIGGTITGTIVAGTNSITVSGITLATGGTGVTLTAAQTSGDALSPGTSSAFTVLDVASQLAFVGAPSNGTVGANIGSFTVEARRPDNTVDTNYTGSISVSVVSGPGNISGTTTVSAVSGIATFNNIQFDAAGTYTLTASSGTLVNATSGNIVISLVPVALVNWDFSGLSGFGASPMAPTSSASTVTSSGLIRGSGVTTTPTAATNAWGGNGWTSATTLEAAITAGAYATFTVTPSAGQALLLNSIIPYNVRRSSSGPITGQWQYSLDGTTFTNIGAAITWGSNTAAAGNNQAAINLSGITALQNTSSTVTFRIVNFGGTGNWYLNNFTGSTAPIDFGITGNTVCIEPEMFTVTGGGEVCEGGPGAAIGLSGSQLGISYQLEVDGTPTGSPVAGTGFALALGAVSTPGTYTVTGSNNNGSCNFSIEMSGSAAVTAVSAPIGGTLSGGTTVCGGENSGTLSVDGFTGTIVKWQSAVTSDFTGTVNDIATADSSYNFTNLSETTYFRVVVGNGTCPVAYSNTIEIQVVENGWTGAEDSNWNNPANWGCNQIPDFSSDVVISPTENQPVIANEVTINSLTLEAGSSLIVNSGYNLTLQQGLNVDASATMTIQNNANLIQVQPSPNVGEITVVRNSSPLMRLDYTLWSSPVAGQNLLDFSSLTLPNRFYVYNSETNVYNSIAPSTNAFGAGTGYLIRMPDNHPATPTTWAGSFTGVPNNGDFNLTMFDGGEGQRFNLVGNPYPSPINMFEFVEANQANITGTLYFWRKTNGANTPAYVTWAAGTFTINDEEISVPGDDYIQTGQGFFVEGSGAGTTLSFDNLMRMPNNGGQFFRAQQEKSRIWINAKSNLGHFAQMAVVYVEGGLNDEVDMYDGRYINDGVIALNSVIGGVDYVINGRSAFVPTDVVPLRFMATDAGQYAISIDHVDGLFEGSQDIYLKDNVTGITHDLKAGQYEFATAAGTFSDRFEIVYQMPLGNHNPVFDENSVIAYVNNGNIAIDSGSSMMKHVQVFDIRGRLIAEKSDIDATATTIAAPTAKQVLIVKITNGNNEVVTRKVMN